MSGRRPVRALGAMSGTSLDGVDAAVIVTDGINVLEFGETGYRPYTEAERSVIRAALGGGDENAEMAAAEVVETAHAELLSQFPDAEVVGFHGQTLWHRPDRGQTRQAGNGALLAEVLERPVVWDFRSSDMKLGGQGAPLAPFFHFALSRRIGASEPLAFLNLGGVGNLTWIDPRLPAPEAPGALLAFDTGPANARIDDLVAARTGRRMDEGGRLAAAGRVDEAALDRMLSERTYFSRMPPKSLDRDDFADWADLVRDDGIEDAVATLAAASAAAVSFGMDHCPSASERLLVAGGGRHNPVLMEMIARGVSCPVEPVEKAGLEGDMIEAQAFAYLAVRVMRGLPTSAPGTTGVAAPVGGGRVSRPGETVSAAI